MSLSGRPGNAGSRFHNCLYEILGLDYVYKSFSTQDLAAAIGGIRALYVRGCAISMPFKEAVIPLIDDLESSARAIDSVNTIVNDDGRLTGYNTDYVAVRQLLEKRIEKPVPFLLRGSGGMAKAVAAALRDAGFANGTIIARNKMAGQAIADQYGFCWQADLPPDSAPLLINVTPLVWRARTETPWRSAQSRSRPAAPLSTSLPNRSTPLSSAQPELLERA